VQRVHIRKIKKLEVVPDPLIEAVLGLHKVHNQPCAQRRRRRAQEAAYHRALCEAARRHPATSAKRRKRGAVRERQQRGECKAARHSPVLYRR
jgi:hypothetical protein